MFRPAARRLGFAIKQSLLNANANRLPAKRCMSSHGPIETDEEADARYERYFNRPDIDGWELRKAINDMHGLDMIPDPKIMIAVLKACRRLNDYALTTRYIESVRDKCGRRVKEIYPYIIQEIRPTLDELGISTPEEMDYGEPELYLQNVQDM